MLRKEGIFIFLTVFMVVLAAIGGYWNFTVNNAPETGALSEPGEGIDAFGWAWSSLTFMAQVSTFTLPNAPIWLSPLFLILDLAWIFLLVLVIRGN